MIQTIGQLLPLAACVALSSVPIMVIITILLGPRSRGPSLAFLIGWAVGMFGVLGLFSLGVSLVKSPISFGSGPLIAWVEIVIGIGLVAYGAINFARTRKRPVSDELPRWLRAMETVRTVPALGLAIVLNLRPKALLISSAAAIVIGSSGLVGSAVVIEILIFVAIGSSTVIVPIIVSLARPNAMRRPLQSARRWITTNSGTVTLVAALLTGVVIVGHGMGDL